MDKDSNPVYISLTFQGFWLERDIDSLLEKNGIFCVYSCTDDSYQGNFSVNLLIDIGCSENVIACIKNHKRMVEWKKLLNPREELCFSFAYLSYDKKLMKGISRENLKKLVTKALIENCSLTFEKPGPLDFEVESNFHIFVSGNSLKLPHDVLYP